MSTVIQTADINMPSDPVSIKMVKDACDEISASMSRAEGERAFQKEAIEELSKKIDVPKKFLGKIARLHHRQNRDQVEAEQEATVELYDKVFGTPQA
jgi:hypothetical protein